MIISQYQATQLLEAKEKRLKEVHVSLDLNKSKLPVKIENGLFIFPDSQRLDESKLKKAIKDGTSCFLIRDGSLIKIKLFSEKTNKFYKLVPTGDAPTIEISGIRMHVTKNFSPIEDTQRKISSIFPVKGTILDTCTGLGYTAIMASKYAGLVVTCEKDDNVLEIAKLNPWSEELFSSKKIKMLRASIFDEVRSFRKSMFDAVIHDPPRLSLAPELYSLEFYRQIYGVLKENGKLYHYTGSPGSRFRKINLAGNVSERLSNAGFKCIQKAHYGLTAEK